VGQGDPGQLCRGEKVDLKDAAQAFRAGFMEVPRSADSSVVDEDVNAAEGGHGTIDQALALLRIGKVSGDFMDLSAALAEFAAQGSQSLSRPGSEH
jgi:hypothetical protein